MYTVTGGLFGFLINSLKTDAIGCFECEAKSKKGWDDADAQCNAQGVSDCVESDVMLYGYAIIPKTN